MKRYKFIRVKTSEVCFWGVADDGMTDGWRDYLSRQRGKELADLRWHWDGAYEITWDGKFRASRVDDGQKLEADTAFELRELMINNYREQRVPRPPSLGEEQGR